MPHSLWDEVSLPGTCPSGWKSGPAWTPWPCQLQALHCEPPVRGQPTEALGFCGSGPLVIRCVPRQTTQWPAEGATGHQLRTCTEESGPGAAGERGEDGGHAPCVLKRPQATVCGGCFHRRAAQQLLLATGPAVSLALCPPCLLGRGLCLYALPTHPQKVSPRPAPTAASPFSGTGEQPCQLISPLLETLDDLWGAKGYFGVGLWGFEMMCRHICFAGCYLFQGGSYLPLWVVVSGSNPPFILLLNIKHLFLTRPVASISNTFPSLICKYWFSLLNFVSAFEFR